MLGCIPKSGGGKNIAFPPVVYLTYSFYPLAVSGNEEDDIFGNVVSLLFPVSLFSLPPPSISISSCIFVTRKS